MSETAHIAPFLRSVTLQMQEFGYTATSLAEGKTLDGSPAIGLPAGSVRFDYTGDSFFMNFSSYKTVYFDPFAARFYVQVMGQDFVEGDMRPGCWVGVPYEDCLKEITQDVSCLAFLRPTMRKIGDFAEHLQHMIIGH